MEKNSWIDNFFSRLVASEFEQRSISSQEIPHLRLGTCLDKNLDGIDPEYRSEGGGIKINYIDGKQNTMKSGK
uniref:Uncharacterized protein n=1 Tax=Setaria digitata TaxID=48799 RepID=A0A915PKK4_9BILA